MEKIKFISFDYSLTSPAMCLSDGTKFFVCAQSAEKKISWGDTEKFTIQVHPYPTWSSQQDRYLKLAETFIKILGQFTLDEAFKAGIEDYAFGAKGKVFHIAENTQMIKYLVWRETGQEVMAIPPTTIKKYFSGKGNSNKDKMAEAFNGHFGFYMHDLLGSKLDGTACDLVDSVAVSWVLQRMVSGEIQPDEVFTKSNTKNFGELKKLQPFQGSNQENGLIALR